uniref:SGNH/GDSL hydrolase family protein n=1 Tax=Candidatus Fimenecus sp. TaxID=3022888 RepID=UPI004029C3AE
MKDIRQTKAKYVMKICKDLITNDVPAVGQLKGSDCISFETTENADIKLLFLGNSITRHGKAENLGWCGDWGMAASSKENDYVHKLISKFCQKGIKVSVCIANLSDWERTRNMDLLFTKYLSVLRFNADYVIVRLGENACPDKYLSEFELCYGELTDLFSRNGAKIVLTDLFWEYEPFDNFVAELAKARGYAFAEIHDLGNDDEMKAIGKFSHNGVAVHPGDKGMAEIAERIFRVLR